MTPQDIDRMYRSAHILKNDENDMPCLIFSRYEFAKQVAEVEREACANIAENWNCNGMPRVGVANAIRTRKGVGDVNPV